MCACVCDANSNRQSRPAFFIVWAQAVLVGGGGLLGTGVCCELCFARLFSPSGEVGVSFSFNRWLSLVFLGWPAGSNGARFWTAVLNERVGNVLSTVIEWDRIVFACVGSPSVVCE